MSKGNLFAASATPAKSKNLVEFKAGKMTMDENKWVYADKRKGLVYIYHSDGLTHFCWKDRVSGVIEDDLLVFPEDAVFKKVSACTTGRVYMLQFHDSKKLFYWIQEPKSDNDDELCKKTNDALNSVQPQPQTSSKGGKREVQELLANAAANNLSQNDLLSILGMDGNALRNAESDGTRTVRIPVGNRQAALPPKLPATGKSKAPSTNNEKKTPAKPVKQVSVEQKFKINDLRSIFSNIKGTNPNRVHLDLTDAVNTESVFPLLKNDEYVKRLAPLLPANSTISSISEPAAIIKNNFQCPQMHVAIKTIGNAIQTGEFSSAISQFNLGPNVAQAAQSGDLKEVCKSMEANLCKSKDSNAQLAKPTESNVAESVDMANTEETVKQGDEAMDHD